MDSERTSDELISERAVYLITTFGNAVFDCGEWTDEMETSYDSVNKIARTARRELVEYVAKLEASCQSK